MLISRPSLNIVATILAKNEADIIGTTIQHHLEAGVSKIIVTNNNSTDNTRAIAEKFPEVVEIIDEPGDDHHQSKWVTRMARLACKLKPDWIVHLDADELWGGLMNLRYFPERAISSNKMYLHPPVQDGFDLMAMSHYLDFSTVPDFEEECKVAHRPDPDITITHGNHGIEGSTTVFTSQIFRHHYPIRSYSQFSRKAVEGHASLKRRGAICKRWETWCEAYDRGELKQVWNELLNAWDSMRSNPNHTNLHRLLRHWSTEDVISFFQKDRPLPIIREWPTGLNTQ